MNLITRNSRREEVTEFEVNVSRSSVAELEGRRQHLQVVDLVHAILELIKIRITFFVGMSAAFGYIIASDGLRIGMIFPVKHQVPYSAGDNILFFPEGRDIKPVDHVH